MKSVKAHTYHCYFIANIIMCMLFIDISLKQWKELLQTRNWIKLRIKYVEFHMGLKCVCFQHWANENTNK